MNRAEGTTRTLAALLTALLACACQDVSKPGLERCQAAEAAGKIEEAFVECEKAASLAPDSDSGMEAKAKAESWRPQLDKIRSERLEAERTAAAEREAEAKKARVEALAAARAKVEVKYWSFERDGQCTGEGKPPMRKTFEGGTFAEDELVAFADGCVHLIDNTREGVLFTQFCCPR